MPFSHTELKTWMKAADKAVVYEQGSDDYAEVVFKVCIQAGEHFLNDFWIDALVHVEAWWDGGEIEINPDVIALCCDIGAREPKIIDGADMQGSFARQITEAVCADQFEGTHYQPIIAGHREALYGGSPADRAAAAIDHRVDVLTGKAA